VTAGATTSNDEMRTQVVRNYRQFVAEVDPRGGIMDHLIEAGVVSVETKERIVSNVTRQVSGGSTLGTGAQASKIRIPPFPIPHSLDAFGVSVLGAFGASKSTPSAPRTPRLRRLGFDARHVPPPKKTLCPPAC